ncbi:MAG: polysaccharide deacetylase family protein [Sphingorhabdus sp.]
MQVEPRNFPQSGSVVDFHGIKGPCFLITIDTEEEFDWSGPFTREQHGLSHLRSIETFQSLCKRKGVTPLYLVDYPVAADSFGAEYFSGLVRDGNAEIGLQLHPWVTPPFSEEVSAYNSYACNLPAETERAKLHQLYEAVVKQMGVEAQIYRAGRYGAGAATPAILGELGIKFDTSVRSLFDYRKQGGPSYARASSSPYWVTPGKLAEIPVTSIFAGALKSAGPIIFDKLFASDAMRALLARSGMLERIALTPEGIPAEKAILAIDCAIEAKLPVLNFSFHSPSLAIGHTPYVRDEAALERFYDWWEQIFDHLARRGAKPVTVAELEKAAFKQ